MYEKYTTSAFVISSRASKEADKHLDLYTKDFGLVTARLISVRNARSKFKGFTEPGIFVSVTLVRGKNIWRICDIAGEKGFKVQKKNLTSWLKSLSLLKSLVHGEERNEALFENLLAAFDFLSKKSHSLETLNSHEKVVAARILAALGYGKEMPPNIPLSGAIHESDLFEASKNSALLLKNINSAIRASHLEDRSKDEF